MLQYTEYTGVRLWDSFDYGHVKDAVNIPPGSTAAEIRAALANVDTGRQLVVYCQSVNCKYAESVARELVAAGYGNACISPGGWEAWNGADAGQR